MNTTDDIVIEFENRQHFLNVLKENPGHIIVKFGATWCKPCKKIKDTVEHYFTQCPKEVICCDLDVDDNIDLYAYLKSVRQVNGIPALLAYKQGNTTFAPDYSYSGTDAIQIKMFFETICNKENQAPLLL